MLRRRIGQFVERAEEIGKVVVADVEQAAPAVLDVSAEAAGIVAAGATEILEDARMLSNLPKKESEKDMVKRQNEELFSIYQKNRNNNISNKMSNTSVDNGDKKPEATVGATKKKISDQDPGNLFKNITLPTSAPKSKGTPYTQAPEPVVSKGTKSAGAEPHDGMLGNLNDGQKAAGLGLLALLAYLVMSKK